MHTERLQPFIEQIGARGVLYEHSANGSPATLAELHPGKILSFSPHHSRETLKAFREHDRERVTLVSSALNAPIYEADLIVLGGYADGRDLAPHFKTAVEKSRRLVAIGGTNQRTQLKRPI